jgi:uncharacterized membrane protein
VKGICDNRIGRFATLALREPSAVKTMAGRLANEGDRRAPTPLGNRQLAVTSPPSPVIEREAPAPRVEPSILSRAGSARFFQTLFFVYVIGTLAVMIFLIPPFMKADEPAHFQRTISVTNLDFTCTKSPNGNYYFVMKRKFVEAPERMHVWDVWIYRDVKFDTNWLKEDFSDPKYREEVFTFENCNLPAVGYLPTALGALAGKPFQNPLISLYLGRLAGAIFFVAVLIYALRITPSRYRPLLYLFGGLPTVLHQVSAVSYDPLHLSLFAIIFAFITKFAFEDQKIKPTHLLIFMAALVLAVNIRLLSYTPLLLLIGAVRPANISLDFGRYLRTAGAFMAGALMITLANILVYLPRVSTGFDPQGIDARRQLSFVLSNPLDFIAASYKTIDLHGDWLFKQGIGVFGWTDTPLAFFPYYSVAFVAGIIIYRLIERDELHLGWLQIASIMTASLLVIVLLFVSLYAIWTPVGGSFVDGLQGRYFIGLIPLGAFAVSQLAARIGKLRFVQLVVVVSMIVLFTNIVRSIDVRYYG